MTRRVRFLLVFLSLALFLCVGLPRFRKVQAVCTPWEYNYTVAGCANSGWCTSDGLCEKRMYEVVPGGQCNVEGRCCTDGSERSCSTSCITNKGACASQTNSDWMTVYRGTNAGEPDECTKNGAGTGQGGPCSCSLNANISGRCVENWTGGAGNCNNFHCNYEVLGACSCGCSDISPGSGCGCGGNPGPSQPNCGSQFGGGVCKWYASVGNPGAECGPGASCNVQTGNCGTGNCLDICGQWLDGGCGITCKAKSCAVTLSTPPSGGYKSDVDPITVTVTSNTEVAGASQPRLFIQKKENNVPPSSSTSIIGWGIPGSFGEYQITPTSGCSSISGGYRCQYILNVYPILPAGDFYAYCDIPANIPDNQPCTGSPLCNFNHTSGGTCTGWRTCDSLPASNIPSATSNTTVAPYYPDWQVFSVVQSATPIQPQCILTPAPTSIPTSSPNSPLSASVTTIINSVEKDTYKVGLNRVSFDPFGPTINGGSGNTTGPVQKLFPGPYSVTYVSGGGVIVVTGKLNTINLSNITASNYWTMDEDPTTIDNARILDYKANNTGKVVGSGVTVSNSGKIGRARSFNGGYIRLNQPINSLEINGWFFANAIRGTDQMIWTSGTTADKIEIGVDTSGRLFARSGSGSFYFVPRVSLGSVVGAWHHFRFVQDTGASYLYHFYMDGVEILPSGPTYNVWGAIPQGQTLIGSALDGSRLFYGLIDEIGINLPYNISTNEIRAWYDLSTNNGSSLVSCPVTVNVSSGAWWQVRGGSIFAPSINNSNIPANTYMILPKTL